MYNDLRYAIRMLLKNPGFTAVAVLTLALGIGANAAIFSVVNAVLLEPLPYRDSTRLVTLWQSAKVKELEQFSLTHAHFVAYRNNNRCFEKLAAFADSNFNFTGTGEPERLLGANVTLDFFDVLGQQPILGRTFLPEEDTPGKNLVCVLSYRLWQRRFGGYPNIVGQSLNLSDIPTQVVGVMPSGFEFPKNTELWIPVGLDAQKTSPYYLRAIGRLKPGVTAIQAQAETTRIGQNFARARPDVHPDGPDFTTVVNPLKSEVVRLVKTPLMILLAAVGAILLIACANLASLLLVRATARAQEIALRVSFGASRWRIVRQLLTESFLLSGVGALVGFALAVWGVPLMSRTLLKNLARVEEIRISGMVLGFSSLLALLSAVTFGLVPALRASKTDLQSHLNSTLRSTASASRRWATDLFVVVQFSLSLVLLVAAGLLLKSFGVLLAVHLGFRPEHVLTLRMSLPSQRYSNENQVRAFYQQLLENVRSLPGIEAAGFSSILPFSGQGWDDTYNAEGYDDSYKQRAFGALAAIRQVTPGYLEAMGIAILAGRPFVHSDQQGTQLVAIVDQALARRHWPSETPIGKRLRFGRPEQNQPWMTIVGLVDTVKHEGLDEDPRAHLYLPYAQYSGGSLGLAVRTSVEPTTMTGVIRKEVQKLDPELPIYDLRSMEAAVAESLSTRKLTNILLGAFAATALLLAAIGIYGLMSATVSERIREFGIRIALGAQSRDVLTLVLRQGVVLVLVGITTGISGALAVTRFLSSLLYGVSNTDPTAFVVGSVLLAGVALLACYIPARRATKVDPVVALRYE